MDVIADCPQVTTLTTVYHQRLLTPAEQVPYHFVTPVEPTAVAPQPPAHLFHQIGLRCLHNEMKMITPQAKGVHRPARFFRMLLPGLLESAPYPANP